MHLGGMMRARRYVPGVASGVLLYIPLALYAFGLSIGSGLVSVRGAILAGGLGLVYNAVPIGYLGFSSMAKRS
jgi:hypothetical protein